MHTHTHIHTYTRLYGTESKTHFRCPPFCVAETPAFFSASLRRWPGTANRSRRDRFQLRRVRKTGNGFQLGPPAVPFYLLGEGSPKIDYRKKGTLILTSLLEDLVKSRTWVTGRSCRIAASSWRTCAGWSHLCGVRVVLCRALGELWSYGCQHRPQADSHGEW